MDALVEPIASGDLRQLPLKICFAGLGCFIFGYAIAYGGDGPLFGTSGWFMVGVDPASGSIPTSVFWLFQAVFAGTAATIVSGAVAERVKLGPFLVFSTLYVMFVYPAVGSWKWGGGWLAERGFHDYEKAGVGTRART